MSDDMWRRRRRDAASDETDEFGGPLFPDDDATTAPSARRGDDTGERRLSFGPNDTGPLPHWTEPPTGEVPRLEPSTAAGGDDDDDDLDVWSSFTTESPVWRDDEPAIRAATRRGASTPTRPAQVYVRRSVDARSPAPQHG